jgi:hypothetical protein
MNLTPTTTISAAPTAIVRRAHRPTGTNRAEFVNKERVFGVTAPPRCFLTRLQKAKPLARLDIWHSNGIAERLCKADGVLALPIVGGNSSVLLSNRGCLFKTKAQHP